MIKVKVGKKSPMMEKKKENLNEDAGLIALAVVVVAALGVFYGMLKLALKNISVTLNEADKNIKLGIEEAKKELKPKKEPGKPAGRDTPTEKIPISSDPKVKKTGTLDNAAGLKAIEEFEKIYFEEYEKLKVLSQEMEKNKRQLKKRPSALVAERIQVIIEKLQATIDKIQEMPEVAKFFDTAIQNLKKVFDQIASLDLKYLMISKEAEGGLYKSNPAAKNLEDKKEGSLQEIAEILFTPEFLASQKNAQFNIKRSVATKGV